MKILAKAVSLGLAVGITWGLYIFVLGLYATYFHHGVELVQLISSLYVGYQATWVGSLLGGLYGLVDGFIFGFFVGFFYKLFRKCGKCGICCPKCGCTAEKCKCKCK